jgi:hypothetical protein
LLLKKPIIGPRADFDSNKGLTEMKHNSTKHEHITTCLFFVVSTKLIFGRPSVPEQDKKVVVFLNTNANVSYNVKGDAVEEGNERNKIRNKFDNR